MTCKTAIKMSKRLALTLMLVGLMATPSLAADVYLVAKAFNKILPGAVSVPMWGFAESNAGFTTTGPATVPGPMITVPPGETTLSIHVQNELPVPVSVVIPGQPAALTPVTVGDRITSFTTETGTGAGTNTNTYTWTGLKAGTYLYHSGTNVAVQVPMGLYGAMKKDSSAGNAYPGHPYDREVVLLYSEIDSAMNADAAATDGALGTTAYPSTINYQPDYYLINGKPFEAGDPPVLAGFLNEKVLLRFLNAGSKAHVPVLHGAYMKLIAEDGNPYPFTREQYSVLLPAGKTKDATWNLNPTPTGIYPLVDQTGHLTNAGARDGGMQIGLEVTTGPPQTIWVGVSQSSDDAEEKASGSMKLGSSDLEMAYDKDNQTVGMRFQGVNIPAGATIQDAHVQFTVDEAGTGSTMLTVQGQLHPNPGTFTSSSNNITNRTPTSNAVTYSPAGWPSGSVGSNGLDQQTPNIKDVVQEIIGQGGWASGNAMVLIVTGNTTSKSDSRIAESYDGSVSSAPMLHVTFLPTGGPPTTTSTTVASTTTTTVASTTTTTVASTTTTTMPATTQTIWVPVSQDSDDAEEKASGSVALGSSDLEMAYDKSNQTVGMRFQGVNIPPGSTIQHAYIQFTVDEAGTGSTMLTVQGQLHPNPGTFTSSSNNITNRTPTSTSVTYSPAGWPSSSVGDAGPDQQTADIKDVVQEIIGQGGWASGNAMVFIVTGNTTSKSDSRIAESHDGSVSRAPVLHVEYQ